MTIKRTKFEHRLSDPVDGRVALNVEFIYQDMV